MAGSRRLPPPPTIPGTKTTGPDLRQLQQQVANLLNRDSPRFPGAQPVSFARKHLSELCERDYYVCEKSDGIRCLLYLTSNLNNEEMVFLIDRKNDYYLLSNIHFPQQGDIAAFHTDTIVDGELVNDLERDGSVKMKYLVFDCLVLDGQILLDRILDKRLGYFRERVHQPFVKCFDEYPEDRDALPFYVDFKTMERAYGLEKLFHETLPNLKHGNDGLIFTSRNTPYRPGTDPNILKWKPPDENSVDFRLYLEFPPLSPPSSPQTNGYHHTNGITKTPSAPAVDYDAMPTFHLAIGGNSGDNDLHFNTLYVTPAEFEHLKSLGHPLDEAIIECYQDEEHRWRFMRIRDDKLEPNHISTVDKVMESIGDRVTREDLIAIGKKVRDAWKGREVRDAQAAKGKQQQQQQQQ